MSETGVSGTNDIPSDIDTTAYIKAAGQDESESSQTTTSGEKGETEVIWIKRNERRDGQTSLRVGDAPSAEEWKGGRSRRLHEPRTLR